MEGWICIYRQMLDNPVVCKDSDYFAVWMYLLLNATHKEYDTLFKGNRITLQKGQLITGTISISNKMKINKDKVQRILKSFEIDKQIAQQTSNKNRLITILNWDKYQTIDKQIDKQLINKCETTDKQLITNNNVNNNNNDNNVTTTVSDSCVDGLQTILEFYNNNIGLITPYGVQLLDTYIQEMPSDLIIFAMQKAVEANKRTIQYIRGILNNWSKKGIRTVLEAKKEDEQFRNKNTSTNNEQVETEEEKIARKIRELEESMENGNS